jgi:hypothetical protein
MACAPGRHGPYLRAVDRITRSVTRDRAEQRSYRPKAERPARAEPCVKHLARFPIHGHSALARPLRGRDNECVTPQGVVTSLKCVGAACGL